jgi:hypothetical protein
MQDINTDAVLYSNGRTRFQQGELGKPECHIINYKFKVFHEQQKLPTPSQNIAIFRIEFTIFLCIAVC